MYKGFCQTIGWVMASLVMFSCSEKKEDKDNRPFVNVVEVTDLNGSYLQSFTGKAKSASEVNLAFRVSGQLTRVYVNEGDHVRSGQCVAEMDQRDYQVQLKATEAEYAQVKADAERVFALYAEGNTTASNYDRAKYGLEQISMKLANHRNQLSDTKLYSNIDGYVQAKHHESGETVGAGMPVVSVFGSGDTEVEIKVSAADYTNLASFTDFYCKFDVTGDEEFPLSIIRTSQEANTNQLYTVRLRFTSSISGRKITPGMTTMVYAQKTSSSHLSEVNLPGSAVMNKASKTLVFIYDKAAGCVKQKEVNVTNINKDGTYLIEGGLHSGDIVVSSGVHHITDGQKVRVMEKPAESNVGGLL